MEGAPLSRVETLMLYVSREHRLSDEDTELNSEFEDHCDRAEYEAKVSKLIRAAYKDDRKSSPAEIPDWWAAIHKLESDDHYILVMVGQAGLRPPGDLWRLLGAAIGVVAALAAFILLSVHFSFPDWVVQAFPWLLLATLVRLWVMRSAGNRKIARAVGGGIAQAIVLIPQAIVTSAIFWVRVGMRRLSRRFR